MSQLITPKVLRLRPILIATSSSNQDNMSQKSSSSVNSTDTQWIEAVRQEASNPMVRNHTFSTQGVDDLNRILDELI